MTGVLHMTLATAIGSFMFLFWLIIPVVLGALATTQGYREDQLGAVATAYSAGIFLSTLSASFLLHRINWRLTAAAGALLSAVGFTLFLADPSSPMIFVSMLIASVGLGATYSVVMAVLGGTESPARRFAILFFLQVVLGVLANTLLTNHLDAEQIISVTSYSMVAIGVASSIASLWLPLSRAPPEPAIAQGQVSQPLSLPVILALLSILLVFTGDAGIWVFLERIGSGSGSSQLGGSLVSVNLMAGAVGSLSAAVLNERLGYLTPMVMAILLSVLSALMFGLMADAVPLLVASFINGWAWNFGAAYRMGLVSKLYRGGRQVALIPTMQTLGNTCGPIMVGWIVVTYSYQAAYWTVSLLWVAALAVYIPAWRTLSRQHPDPA